MDRNIYFSNRLSAAPSPSSSIFPAQNLPPLLGHSQSLASLTSTAAAQCNQSTGGTSYSTVSRLPHHLSHLAPSVSDSDLPTDAGGEGSSMNDAEVGVSSARYFNQRPPPAYFNLSPSVITTTSTVRRGPEGKL